MTGSTVFFAREKPVFGSVDHGIGVRPQFRSFERRSSPIVCKLHEIAEAAEAGIDGEVVADVQRSLIP